MMRAAGIALAAVLLGFAPLSAQQRQGTVAEVRNVLSPHYRLDFAVPSVPALLLADVSESELLRPGTLHELGLAAADFTGGGGFRLPKSYGVEVAPVFLRQNLDREAYRRARPLSWVRLSAAARRMDDAGATAVAFGLRTSLVNRQDLRADTAYHRRIDPLVIDIQRLGDSIAYAGMEICEAGDLACFLAEPPAATAPAPADRVAAYTAKRAAAIQRLAQVRDSVVAERWNSPVFDVAFAVGVATRDSLGHDPRVSAYAGWASWGFPLGGSRSSQVVLGGHYGVARDTLGTAWEARYHAGARLYLGRNAYKGFVEAGWQNQEAESGFLARSGVELKLVAGVWATLLAGYEDGMSGRGRLVSRFFLRAAPLQTVR